MGKRTENWLFTAREAASYLGLSRRDLRGLVRDGAIPYLRRGRRVLFRRGDLDAVRSRGPSRIFATGVLFGAVAMGVLRWARGSRGTRRRMGMAVPPTPIIRRTRGRRIDRRQELLTEFHGLLTSHYAATRFMAALLVLNNRRVGDRRKKSVPVAVDRRSGRDRRASPNIDAQVDEWHRRLAVAARRTNP